MTGHDYRRYRFEKRTFRNQYLGPFVNHEMNRCIQCYRCVRFYREYAGGRDLNAFGLRDHRLLRPRARRRAGKRVQRQPGGGLPHRRLHRQDAQAALHAQMGPADGALGLRALRRWAATSSAGERYGMLRRILQPLQRRGQRLFPLRPRALRLRVREQRAADPPAVAPWQGRYARRAALDYLRGTGRRASAIGIGSPRASLESNFALRTLVGDRPVLCRHFRNANAGLLKLMLDILRRGPARTPSLREMEARRRGAHPGRGRHQRRAANGAEPAAVGAPAAHGDRRATRGFPLWMDHAVREAAQERERAAVHRQHRRHASGRHRHAHVSRRARRPGAAGLRGGARARCHGARAAGSCPSDADAWRRKSPERSKTPSGRWSSRVRQRQRGGDPGRRERGLGVARTPRSLHRAGVQQPRPGADGCAGRSMPALEAAGGHRHHPGK